MFAEVRILEVMKLFCILIASVPVSTYDNIVLLLQDATIERNWFNNMGSPYYFLQLHASLQLSKIKCLIYKVTVNESEIMCFV